MWLFQNILKEIPFRWIYRKFSFNYSVSHSRRSFSLLTAAGWGKMWMTWQSTKHTSITNERYYCKSFSFLYICRIERFFFPPRRLSRSCTDVAWSLWKALCFCFSPSFYCAFKETLNFDECLDSWSEIYLRVGTFLQLGRYSLSIFACYKLSCPSFPWAKFIKL